MPSKFGQNWPRGKLFRGVVEIYIRGKDCPLFCVTYIPIFKVKHEQNILTDLKLNQSIFIQNMRIFLNKRPMDLETLT